jgi:predicted CXXCH cytochrome family protein
MATASRLVYSARQPAAVLGLVVLLGVWGGGSARAASSVYAVNPHSRSKCIACHVSEDDEAFLDENMNTLCSRCHDQTDPRWKHHPLRKVPPGMKIPEEWSITEGSLTCVTCHTPGHEEDRDVPKLLRDGPYEVTEVFCRKCHPDADSGAEDVHRELNLGKGGCPTCHDKTPVPGTDTFSSISLVSNVRIICLMCHDNYPHPGGTNHHLLQPGVQSTIRLLHFADEQSQVTCVSCHNPHLLENDSHKLRDSVLGEEVCWRCHTF